MRINFFLVIFLKENPHALRYYGGKTRGLDKILPFFPANMKKCVYVEPFCGALNIAFAVDSFQVILNDLDEDLQNFWWVVRGYPLDFERYEPYKEFMKFPLYDMMKLELLSAQIDITYFHKLKAQAEIETDPDRRCVLRAICYYLKNRWVFSGVMSAGDTSTFYSSPGRVRLAEEFAFWHKWFSARHCRIWNLDFRECITRINKLSGKDRKIFMYLDPPYIKGGGQYTKTMCEQDHRDLADLLKASKHEWVLSYDNDPLVRELYKDFHIYETDWAYSCSVYMEPEARNKELIITNADYGSYD